MKFLRNLYRHELTFREFRRNIVINAIDDATPIGVIEDSDGKQWSLADFMNHQGKSLDDSSYGRLLRILAEVQA